MAEADPYGPESNAQETKRNTRLILLNGGLNAFAGSFASSEAVIPAYLQQLTRSSVLVGLSSAMMRVGWSWPQILISNRIEGRRANKPVCIRVNLMRCAVTAGIGIATWFLSKKSPFSFGHVFLVGMCFLPPALLLARRIKLRI